MALDEATILLFDAYLDETLSASERLELEKRLESNSTLREEFELFKEINEHLTHQFSEERTEIQQTLTSLGDDHFSARSISEVKDAPKKGTVLRLQPWHYTIAATILLLLGWFLYSNSMSPNIEDYRFSDSINLTMRAEQTESLKEAELYFNKGNYEEAIAPFENLLLSDPNNAELQFYLAIAYSHSQQYDQAHLLFEEIAAGRSTYKYRALYFQAITYWEQDLVGQAKVRLKNIPESAEDFEEAQKLLNKL